MSWYPTGESDDEGEPPDRLIPTLLNAAEKYDLKVNRYSIVLLKNVLNRWWHVII